ncbi:MAG: thioredoxin domain-containing protein [bacterium]|nr:thioredoxin domain-containing protein [bacterium]
MTLFSKRAIGTFAVAVGMLTAVTSSAYAAPTEQEFKEAMGQYLGKEENLDQLGQALESYFQKKQEKARASQAKEEEASIEEQFKNPVKVDIGSSPVRGSADAPVTIVEFSDFQCPYCSRGKAVMEEVLKSYPGKVKVVFKNLPLPFHPEAEPAAIAALAAGKQGKFWEMHDLLFDNQAELSSAKYLEFAGKLGLDLNKFKDDLDSAEVKKAVKDDAELAGSLGVRGTPGFFVNGVQVKGARPAAYFNTLIDRWLAK